MTEHQRESILRELISDEMGQVNETIVFGILLLLFGMTMACVALFLDTSARSYVQTVVLSAWGFGTGLLTGSKVVAGSVNKVKVATNGTHTATPPAQSSKVDTKNTPDDKKMKGEK